MVSVMCPTEVSTAQTDFDTVRGVQERPARKRGLECQHLERPRRKPFHTPTDDRPEEWESQAGECAVDETTTVSTWCALLERRERAAHPDHRMDRRWRLADEHVEQHCRQHDAHRVNLAHWTTTWPIIHGCGLQL